MTCAKDHVKRTFSCTFCEGADHKQRAASPELILLCLGMLLLFFLTCLGCYAQGYGCVVDRCQLKEKYKTCQAHCGCGSTGKSKSRRVSEKSKKRRSSVDSPEKLIRMSNMDEGCVAGLKSTTKWAICIAIDEYGPASGLQRLEAAVSDATSVRKALKEQHHFRIFKYLHNKDATYDKIRNILVDKLGKEYVTKKGTRRKIKKGDQLLIYLAGHGDERGFLCYDYDRHANQRDLERTLSLQNSSSSLFRGAKKNKSPAANNSAESPADSQGEEAERKATDAQIKRISYKHLMEDIVQASGVPVDQILFIIDACHAGTAGDYNVTLKHRTQDQSLNTNSSELPALHAMGSCAGDELAIEVEEKGKMQGLFTKCFLQAIDPSAKYEDGLVAFEPGNLEVTAHQIFMKIGDRVALEARRRGTRREQNPQFGSIVSTDTEWHGRRAQGQFLFWRPFESAQAHKDREKNSVDLMRHYCEERRRADSWTDSLVRLHEVLGSFRYHHCLDILSASYQGKGLPLILVCDVLNMLPANVINLIKWHQKDSKRTTPAYKYQILEILFSKQAECAVNSEEDWKKLRKKSKKEKRNATAWVRLVKKPTLSQQQSFEEWCFRHTEDQKHEHCPKSWENPGCCGSLLPKQAAGHAVLGSRCTLADKAYLPVARRWHNMKRVSHLMPKSMRDGLSKGVFDIVGSTGTKIRLMWGFFQCLAYMPIVFEVPWPRFMVDMSSWMREMTSEILVSFFGWHCSLQADFLAIFGAYMTIIPVLLFTAFLADKCARTKRMANRCGYEVVGSAKSRKKKKKNGKEQSRKTQRRCGVCLELVSTTGERFWWTVEDVILDKLYNPVCTQLFWFFRCRQIQDTVYLLSDMRVKCWEGAHFSMAPVAFFCILAFMFGIPLLQLLYMWWYREYLHRADIDLSDRLPVEVRRKARERHRRVKKRIGALYEQYTDECYWVNILEKLHTLMISGGVVILGPDSVARCLMAILISSLWILFLVYKTPYRAAWDNLLASILGIELILTLVIGLAANSSGEEILTISAWNSTASADLSFEENAKGFFIGVTNIMVIAIGGFAIIGSLPFLRYRILSQYSSVSKLAKKAKKAISLLTAKLVVLFCAVCCCSFNPKQVKKKKKVNPTTQQLGRSETFRQRDGQLLEHEIKEIAENLQLDLEPKQVDAVIRHLHSSMKPGRRQGMIRHLNSMNHQGGESKTPQTAAALPTIRRSNEKAEVRNARQNDGIVTGRLLHDNEERDDHVVPGRWVRDNAHAEEAEGGIAPSNPTHIEGNLNDLLHMYKNTPNADQAVMSSGRAKSLDSPRKANKVGCTASRSKEIPVVDGSPGANTYPPASSSSSELSDTGSNQRSESSSDSASEESNED
jgi:hypothetical protein